MVEAVVLLHSVRSSKGAPLEPAGAWYVDDSGRIDEWYPDGQEPSRKRGWKALTNHPASSSLEWARYRASTSPNWRIVASTANLFDDVRPEALEGHYRSEHDTWTATLLQAFESAVGERTSEKAFQERASNAPLATTWGANRIVNAQSWWIAAELVRRNPSLAVYETHPGDGMYDVLTVTTPETMSTAWTPQGLLQPKAMLNRVGSIQMHIDQEVPLMAPWTDVLGAPDPHSLIKRLEVAARWVPRLPAASTDRALTYRFCASLLTMTQNARVPWDVRMTFEYEGRAFPAGVLDDFPLAIQAADASPRTGAWLEPFSHFWAVRRGDEVVAVVSDAGTFFAKGGKTHSLMEQYSASNRKLEAMVVNLIGEWL